MKITEKRNAGKIFGREGISERIILIAMAIERGSYKDAIELGGRIAELVAAASYDDYWKEKADIGRSREQNRFTLLLNKPDERDFLCNEI